MLQVSSPSFWHIFLLSLCLFREHKILILIEWSVFKNHFIFSIDFFQRNPYKPESHKIIPLYEALINFIILFYIQVFNTPNLAFLCGWGVQFNLLWVIYFSKIYILKNSYSPPKHLQCQFYKKKKKSQISMPVYVCFWALAQKHIFPSIPHYLNCYCPAIILISGRIVLSYAASFLSVFSLTSALSDRFLY
jgi:hypothetical protein